MQLEKCLLLSVGYLAQSQDYKETAKWHFVFFCLDGLAGKRKGKDTPHPRDPEYSM
jgi:hypothetical protein